MSHPPPAPDPKATEFALDQSRRIARARAKLPSLEDIRKDIGRAADGVTVDDEGQCGGQVVGHEAVARLMDMQHDWRKEEIERSAILNASIPSVDLGVDAVTGRRVSAPEHNAEKRISKGGIRFKPYRGRRVKRYLLNRDGSWTVIHPDGTVEHEPKAEGRPLW
ncbi:MAG TPA: hypothetical protein VJZ25_01360 [Gemmatimonadaceae bacterium]|nr:hypothetical protein [Gemmatimonadaceae bacterium]